MSTENELDNQVLALVSAIQAGECDKLVELWGLVKNFVAKMARNRIYVLRDSACVEFDDLFNSGYIAIVNATNGYDFNAGRSFLSYLALHLRNAFNEAAGTRGDKQRRDPLHKAISLNAYVTGYDETITVEDTTADPQDQFAEAEERIYNEHLRFALDKAINRLPSQKQAVLRAYFFEGEDFEAIGNDVGMSASCARRISQSALQRLRCKSISNELQTYLEDRTNYYDKVGVKEFHQTGTSPVEKLAMRREHLTELASQRKYVD